VIGFGSGSLAAACRGAVASSHCPSSCRTCKSASLNIWIPADLTLQRETARAGWTAPHLGRGAAVQPALDRFAAGRDNTRRPLQMFNWQILQVLQEKGMR